MDSFDFTMVKVFIPLVRVHRNAKKMMPNIALVKHSRRLADT